MTEANSYTYGDTVVDYTAYLKVRNQTSDHTGQSEAGNTYVGPTGIPTTIPTKLSDDTLDLVDRWPHNENFPSFYENFKVTF